MSKNKEKIKRIFASKELKETKHYSKKESILVIVLVLVLSSILAVVGSLIIKHEFSDTNSFSRLVEENYLLSVVVMILICALQVMVALIPGELVEIASGYAFGAWLGALYCLLGILLGSCIVILLTRKFGRRFIESLCPREKIDSISWIRDNKKFNLVVSLVFSFPEHQKIL